MRYLTEKERESKCWLRERGVLCDIERGEWTKNGGVAIMCGDGDAVEQRRHHGAVISKRPHLIAAPGGILRLAPSFTGYSSSHAEAILEWAKDYVGIKKTSTAFLYGHWPCGAADGNGVDLLRMVALAGKARQTVVESGIFPEEKVHLLFHIRKTAEDGPEEMRTYRLFPEAAQ